MRNYFHPFRFRFHRLRTVVALLTIGVCTPALAADFRGSLLSRARSMQNLTSPSGNGNAVSAFKAPVQTPVSNSTAGRTLGKRKLNSTSGSTAGQMQLNPNAGHTLGKRKLNTSSSASGMTSTQPWQKSRVIAAPNGNTGITGAGLPASVNSRVSNAARIATPQPQQVMSLLPGVPDWADPVGVIIEEGVKVVTGDKDAAGNHKLPPAPPASNFEGSIKAQANDPNAGHTLGKRKKKFDTGSLAGKFDPNAGTSVQLPKLPGGNAPTNPAPPTTPAPSPTPAPQGKVGSGFPWQDVVVGTAIGLANRPVAYETPLYVPAAQPPVQQVVVSESPTAVEAKPVETVQGTADLVLENIEQAAPATLLVGPAYRVTFRNQSAVAVGAFRVAIFAGSDGKLSDTAPRAVMEIAGIEGGEVSEATLRMPAAAMKLVSSNSQHSGFSYLVVAVDAANEIAELDETNNNATVDRSALDAAAQ